MFYSEEVISKVNEWWSPNSITDILNSKTVAKDAKSPAQGHQYDKSFVEAVEDFMSVQGTECIFMSCKATSRDCVADLKESERLIRNTIDTLICNAMLARN